MSERAEHKSKYVESLSTRSFESFVLRHRDVLCDRKHEHLWCRISANEGISCEFVNANLDLPWSWSYLSKNPNLTHEFVEQHIDKMWNVHTIITNPNLSMDTITMIIRKDSYLPSIYWTLALSMHPRLTPDFVECNANWDWQWINLSNNKEFCRRCMEQGKFMDNLITFCKWVGIYVNHLSYLSPEIQQELVKAQNINLRIMSKVRRESWEDFWNLRAIAEDMDICEIDQCPEVFESVWIFVSLNPTLTSDFIGKYIDNEWDWDVISSNSCITQELVSRNLYKSWNWCGLCKLESITPEFVVDSFRKRNINLNFSGWCVNRETSMIQNTENEGICWTCLSCNPNLSSAFIEEHMLEHVSDFNWDLLASNDSVDPEYVYYMTGNKEIKFICKNSYKRLDLRNTKKLLKEYSVFPMDITDSISCFI